MVVTLGEESATGVLWIEARDAAEDCTVHHLLPTGKHYPALNINRAEVEKPCSGPKAPGGRDSLYFGATCTLSTKYDAWHVVSSQ